MGPSTVLRCDGLVRRFGARTAVDHVSLFVPEGQVYGLLGPNGAGKTTTIKMVCGLLRPDEGRAEVSGLPAASRAARRLVGYVPQDVALYPDLTARENLRFVGRLYGLSGPLLEERVAEALELTELTARRRDRVEGLSGGMRRRLNIAAGLVHRPRLLVLDEPTVGVDPQSRHAILERVRSFAERGMGVLYTTHYMEEADRVCDRVGIIDHGALIAEGTRRELVAELGEHDRIELGADGDLDALAAGSAAMPGVAKVAVGDHRLELVAVDGRRLLPGLLELAERSGVEVTSIDVVEPDLEAVFLHLTGTALRE